MSRLGNFDETEPRSDGTRRTTKYDIDLTKCIFCGFVSRVLLTPLSKLDILNITERNEAIY